MSASQLPPRQLSYVPRLRRRPLNAIDLVVVHCTELPDLQTARDFGERILHEESQTGNSGHFYIERNGLTEEWVPVERVAHHVRGFNERSIGIELVNRGRFPDWFDSRSQAMQEPYPPAQIQALLRLLDILRLRLSSLRWIAGHEELDREHVTASDDQGLLVRRKVDPGPLFPWSELLPVCGLERLPEVTED